MPSHYSRRLPHYTFAGHPIFLTWSLHGSLPKNRAFPPATTSGRAFHAFDTLLATAASGPFDLARPELADMVESALHYHEKELRRFELHRYVIMPNHVHMLITPNEPVCKVMQSLKRFTARQANMVLCREGKPFWQDESFDRLVRDRREFERISRYIDYNPVQAGLVGCPEEYPWCSAASESKPIDNRLQVTNLPHGA